MALPQSACSPEPPCCTSVFEAAQSAVEAIAEDLVSCIPMPCGQSLAVFVQFGDEMVMADSLSFVIDGMRFVSSVVGPGGRELAIGRHVLLGRVRLIESGWPIVDTAGDAIIPPSLEDLAAASQHALAHGERLYRSLHDRLRVSEPPCRFVEVGDLVPVPVAAGLFGWEMAVDVEVDLAGMG